MKKEGVRIENRKARFEYFFLDRLEAGIELTGSEVKSLRFGGGELVNSYVYINSRLEVFTFGLKIRKPKTSTDKDFNPERQKRLLLHKKEILKLKEKLKEKGTTIVPVALYFNKRGFAKLEIALAKGKMIYDKRKSIKERDIKRQERRDGVN